MMENLITTLTNLLDGASITLIAAAAFFLLAVRTLHRAQRQVVQQRQQILSLQRDLKAITAAGVGMGQRVVELERRQRRLAERQETTDPFDAANQPYEQAIRMAQTGAKPKELVDICGLSQSEADLISLMHRLDKAS